MDWNQGVGKHIWKIHLSVAGYIFGRKEGTDWLRKKLMMFKYFNCPFEH